MGKGGYLGGGSIVRASPVGESDNRTSYKKSKFSKSDFSIHKGILKKNIENALNFVRAVCEARLHSRPTPTPPPAILKEIRHFGSIDRWIRSKSRLNIFYIRTYIEMSSFRTKKDTSKRNRTSRNSRGSDTKAST